MSQFNPNMTKAELVNRFRDVNPSYNSMTDDTAYRMIIRKFPQYKLNEELEFEYKPEDGTGIIDALGKVWKDGYNRSLQGMSEAIATNKDQVYDLGNYHPGLIADLGAGIASFFMPLDFATTVLGGGIGGFATKGVARKLIYRKLLKNRASKDVANKAALKASAFQQKLASKAGGGAGALGLYSGAGEALNEYLSDGTISPGKVVKAGAKGVVLGGMTGGTDAFLTQAGAGVVSRTLAEVAGFGTASPLLEGRAPTIEDWAHAGGMILGIKGVNKVATTGFNKLNEFRKNAMQPELRFESVPDELKYQEGFSRATQKTSQQRMDDIYADKKGRNKFKVIGEDKDNMFVKFFAKKESEKMPKDIFYTYNRLIENVNIEPNKLRKIYIDDIRSMEKELNYSKKMKETSRALVKGDVTIPRTLKELSNVERGEYRKKLQFESELKKQITRLEKDGILHAKPRYSVFLDEMLPAPAKKLFDYFRPARNVGTIDPARRIYIAKVDKFVVDQRRTLAETYDLMNINGFNKKNPTTEQVKNLSRAMNISESQVKKNYWELLTDAVEQGVEIPETIAYKQITDFLFNKATESGVKIPGYFDRYVASILKPNVAEKIFSDVYKLADIVSKQAKRDLKGDYKMYSLKDDVIDMIIQAMNNPETFAKNKPGEAKFLNRIIKKTIPSLSKETRETYETILGGLPKLEELSPFKAMSLMGRLTYGEVFRMDGNLEKSRKYKLPKNLYERDIRKLLGIYSANVARRSSEVKHFGREGKIYENLLQNARQEDIAIMRELHNHVMGTIGRNRNYNLNPGIKDFMQKVMEWETSTKIALGTATAMNLSQFAISSALSAGYWRFTKGAYLYHTDKDFKRQVDASGANLYKYINEMMGISQQGDISKKVVGRLTDISQFNRINSINNILAAASARVLIDDLVAISSGKRGFGLGRTGSKQWADATLTKMGIDPKSIKKGKISNTNMIDAIGKFAIKSQLQKDILADPLVLNRPAMKPFLQFKSFGFRQYKFIVDTLKHDLSLGNFMPILRLAAGGMATGAVSLKAKELLKFLASGEKAYDPSTFFETDGREIVENIAAIGAFGFLGDFLMAGLEEGKTVTNALIFFVSPPFVSDIEGFFQFLENMERDYKNYRGDFIKRAFPRGLKMTGSPLLRDLSKRFETKGLKESRIKFLRGRKRTQILDALVKSSSKEDYQRALDDIRDWNKAYPLYPITVSDIGRKEVIKRKMQKAKKRREV